MQRAIASFAAASLLMRADLQASPAPEARPGDTIHGLYLRSFSDLKNKFYRQCTARATPSVTLSVRGSRASGCPTGLNPLVGAIVTPESTATLLPVLVPFPLSLAPDLTPRSSKRSSFSFSPLTRSSPPQLHHLQHPNEPCLPPSLPPPTSLRPPSSTLYVVSDLTRSRARTHFADLVLHRFCPHNHLVR